MELSFLIKKYFNKGKFFSPVENRKLRYVLKLSKTNEIFRFLEAKRSTM